MRRMCALLLLLAVSIVTSSPAWALALAQHGCCAPSATSKSQTAIAKNAPNKHAHCAAMAHVLSESADRQSSTKITALHSCNACAGVTSQAPRSALSATTLFAIAVPSPYEIAAVHEQARTLKNVLIRDQRGPPYFLL